ncbi:hypothetical protein Lesp02_72880 [Lentzea sp. NBRC 105346]|uniref:hypothetical protein n=1 Tax=Lentzea sp. NBRC 105346 TaxID=3032205 RepID=UPI0024A0D3C7|nr:hypothetical protein [Lentzea sp. NBRC 105346]GLZ35101.1 hypothetical protein Lesp02_72880 [Lentzea sp. NBRC 105346]
MNLAELLDRSGTAALDHLERQVTIPVIDGLQAQGDLIVIPLDLTDVTFLNPRDLPPGGVELIRGAGGNNPHTLVADPDTCRWSDQLHDRLGLAIAVFENSAPVYLVHPEHGGTGVAPGRWLVRRQRERSLAQTRSLFRSLDRSGTVLVAD